MLQALVKRFSKTPPDEVRVEIDAVDAKIDAVKRQIENAEREADEAALDANAHAAAKASAAKLAGELQPLAARRESLQRVLAAAEVAKATRELAGLIHRRFELRAARPDQYAAIAAKRETEEKRHERAMEDLKGQQEALRQESDELDRQIDRAGESAEGGAGEPFRLLQEHDNLLVRISYVPHEVEKLKDAIRYRDISEEQYGRLHPSQFSGGGQTLAEVLDKLKQQSQSDSERIASLEAEAKQAQQRVTEIRKTIAAMAK